MDERDVLFDKLKQTVLQASGANAAFTGDGELARKVHEHAYRVTPEEIAALVAKHGEDAVFEIAIAAAVGAGAKRLEALKRVLP